MGSPIDPRRFRQALGTFTTGVTIVTTVNDAGADVGVTANSFNSVSLDPPMVLWSIGRSSTNFATFMAAKHFAVHVLAADQDELASRFAKRGVDRFAGLAPGRGPGGIALLEGCAARFVCKLAYQHEGGDHAILVGEVLEFDLCDAEPLVFKGGRFALAVAKGASASGAARIVPAPDAATSREGTFAPDFLVYQLGRAYFQIVAKLQPELQRRSIGVAEYFALSLLGVRDGRTLAELDSLVAYTGVRIRPETARVLTGMGLATMDGEGEQGRLSLTPYGLRVQMELLALAKTASDEAEQGFDPSESRLLRQLLDRVIAASDPGLPSPWQG